MSKRSVPYAGRRVARRRPAPPQRTPPPRRRESQPTPASRRRMAQLLVSAALLLAVVVVKLLFPAALERCRATLLELLGAAYDELRPGSPVLSSGRGGCSRSRVRPHR